MMRLAYIPGTSYLHQMDPTLKLVWNFLVALLITINLAPLYAAFWFGYVFTVAIVLARLPLRRFFGLLFGFTLIAAFLGLWQAVYNPLGTEVLWAWGPLRITREGLVLGTALFFRVLALVSLAASFTLTTSPARLVESLIQVARVSYRLAFTLYAGLRFMPLFQDEAQVITNAHLVRGVGAGGRGPLARLKQSWSLAVPLLVSGIRRARAAAIAMDSRAFGAYPQRTVLHPQPLRALDVAFVLVHGLVAVALFYYYIILGNGRLFIG